MPYAFILFLPVTYCDQRVPYGLRYSLSHTIFRSILTVMSVKVAAKKEADKKRKEEAKKKEEEAAAAALQAAAAALKPAAVSVTDIAELSLEEREKRIKAVKKKLKSIDEVKEKKAAGGKLDAGQVNFFFRCAILSH